MTSVQPISAFENDRKMMAQCIALSRASGEAGEYPYGAIISRGGEIIASSINRVRQDGDITRHAEVVAISAAQKKLGSVSLDDCTIYANAEPCALCCYAIRESRIGKVVYGLQSPHMGGVSKWQVLADEDLSRAMPEVFAPPPGDYCGLHGERSRTGLVRLESIDRHHHERARTFWRCAAGDWSGDQSWPAASPRNPEPGDGVSSA